MCFFKIVLHFSSSVLFNSSMKRRITLVPRPSENKKARSGDFLPFGNLMEDTYDEYQNHFDGYFYYYNESNFLGKY